MAASYVSGRPPAGVGIGVGVGGSWLCSRKASRSAGASNPANSQVWPWQPLFEQNDVLLTPPGSSVVWQLAHAVSKTSRCSAIQLEFKCDSDRKSTRLNSTHI